jgi:hypothetical protein
VGRGETAIGESIRNQKVKDKRLDQYWINTGSIEAVEKAAQRMPGPR